jgi:hypothetical protein
MMLEREASYTYGDPAAFEEDLEHEFKEFKQLLNEHRFKGDGDIGKNVHKMLSSFDRVLADCCQFMPATVLKPTHSRHR